MAPSFKKGKLNNIEKYRPQGHWEQHGAVKDPSTRYMEHHWFWCGHFMSAIALLLTAPTFRRPAYNSGASDENHHHMRPDVKTSTVNVHSIINIVLYSEKHMVYVIRYETVSIQHTCELRSLLIVYICVSLLTPSVILLTKIQRVCKHGLYDDWFWSPTEIWLNFDSTQEFDNNLTELVNKRTGNSKTTLCKLMNDGPRYQISLGF